MCPLLKICCFLFGLVASSTGLAVAPLMLSSAFSAPITSPALFAMLDKDRLDLAIMEKLMGLYLVKQLHLPGIHPLQPAFFASEQFLYLNKKHAALVPQLSLAIRSMKQDGSYQRIFSDVMRGLPLPSARGGVSLQR